MAAPRRSWIDSPSTGVSLTRIAPAMPLPFRPPLSTARTRCCHRHNGRTDVRAAPVHDPTHRAGCSTEAVTVVLLAEFLLPAVTPSRLPSTRLADTAGSIEVPVCPSPGVPRVPSAHHGSRGRRTHPQTTHLQHVTVNRPEHPFEGQSLGVFGHTHREGRLHLILILPDGSRSMIPADWTDFQSN